MGLGSELREEEEGEGVGGVVLMFSGSLFLRFPGLLRLRLEGREAGMLDPAGTCMCACDCVCACVCAWVEG